MSLLTARSWMNSSSFVMLGWPSRGAGVSKTHGKSSNVRALRAAMVDTARSVPSRTSSLFCGLRRGRPYLP
eukprot:11452305-Heterocapsa_arctica.AAC.1